MLRDITLVFAWIKAACYLFCGAMNLWDNYDKSLVWYSRTHVHHIISIKGVWSLKTISYGKQRKLITFFQVSKTKENSWCSFWCYHQIKRGFWTCYINIFMSVYVCSWNYLGKQNIPDPDHIHVGVGSQKALRGRSRISRREVSTLFGETGPTFFPFLQKNTNNNKTT